MKPIILSLALPFLIFCSVYFSSGRLVAMEYAIPQDDFIFVKGHGSFPDLDIAMMSDPSLYVSVANLKKRTFEDFINIRVDIEGEVENILFQWAGVTGMNPSARGPNIDARALTVLEKFTDRPFVQEGAGGEIAPLFWAASSLQQGYYNLFSYQSSFMLGQGPARALFTGNIRYKKTGDGGLTGMTGINPDAVTKIVSAASALQSAEDKYFLWERVLRVIDNTIGITRLSKDQQSLLYFAVKRSGVDWETVYDRIDYLHPRDMVGSSFAEKTLGMTVRDCDLMNLYAEARKRSDTRQVVINSLATKLISQCAEDEKSAVSFLTRNGFLVQDATSQHDQHEDFGNRVLYDRIYYASKLTKKNQILSFLMLPYDGYYAQLFVRNGRVEWVAAYAQRAHRN